MKNWPTIFLLAATLLAVWEEMQFDCHYRIPVRLFICRGSIFTDVLGRCCGQ